LIDYPSPPQFELNSNHEDTQPTLEKTLEDFMQFSKRFLSTNDQISARQNMTTIKLASG